MKVAVAADHGGFRLKIRILEFLRDLGHDVLDIGTHSEKPVDYPEYASALCATVVAGAAEKGILICGSGVGASIAANKIPGIRAGLCHDSFSARQSVEDDDCNVLCLGARVVGPELAVDLVRIWTSSSFSGAERHKLRLRQIEEIERSAACAKSGAEQAPATDGRCGCQ